MVFSKKPRSLTYRIFKAEACRRDGYQYFLEVSRGNKAALQLYQKMGFHVYHERKSYYQDGSNALLMTRLPQV